MLYIIQVKWTVLIPAACKIINIYGTCYSYWSLLFYDCETLSVAASMNDKYWVQYFQEDVWMQ